MPDLQPLIQLPWGRLALLFLCIYMLFCALAFLYADKILFPAPTPPACLEEEVDFFFVSTESGIRIACVAEYPKHPRGRLFSTVTGMGRTLGIPLRSSMRLDKGFEIIAYDYPGYGVSGGESSEEGCYEAIEARPTGI